MNADLTKLVEHVRGRYPQLDVRSDQCDTVRIIAKREQFVAGVRRSGGSYSAKFISLSGGSPIADTVLATVEDTDADRFEEDVLQLLSKMCRS